MKKIFENNSIIININEEVYGDISEMIYLIDYYLDYKKEDISDMDDFTEELCNILWEDANDRVPYTTGKINNRFNELNVDEALEYATNWLSEEELMEGGYEKFKLNMIFFNE